MTREEQVQRNLGLARRHLERLLAYPDELTRIPPGASLVLTDRRGDPELSRLNEQHARELIEQGAERVVVIDISVDGIASDEAVGTPTIIQGPPPPA